MNANRYNSRDQLVADADADATIKCECGEAMGQPCEWSGPRQATVIVEWMPVWLRESHAAARNSGSYPHNGAVRFRAERGCADNLAEHDSEWTKIVTD